MCLGVNDKNNLCVWEYIIIMIIVIAVRRDSSAVKFDRVEISFILGLFYWLKPYTDEGG